MKLGLAPTTFKIRFILVPYKIKANNINGMKIINKCFKC
jgi:hypothetical protein